jgi:hypothetical protein
MGRSSRCIGGNLRLGPSPNRYPPKRLVAARVPLATKATTSTYPADYPADETPRRSMLALHIGILGGNRKGPVRRSSRRRLVGGVLVGAASCLLIAATFLP